MKEKDTKKKSLITPRKGIFFKTILVSALTITFTIGFFFLWLIPFQKNVHLENLESSAKIALTSVSQTLATAIIAEDYSFVVEHCTKVVTDRDSIHYIIVTRKDGFSLIHKRNMNNEEAIWYQSEEVRFIPSMGQISEGKIIPSDIVKTDVFHYTQPFTYSVINWGWIHVGMSLDKYNHDLKATINTILSLAILCILLGIIMAVMFARQLSQPILALEKVARSFGMGDLSIRAKIKTGDEIESLANSLNNMADALMESQKELIEANEFTENIMMSMTDSLIVTDQESRIISVNRATLELSGYAEEETRNVLLVEFFDQSSDVLGNLLDRLKQDGLVTNFESSLSTKNGFIIPILVSASLMRDDFDNIQGMVFIVKDITELKEAEEALLYRSKFEGLITTISNRFINLPPDRTDEGISLSLAIIGEFVGVDRCYLFQFSPSGRSFSNTHEWCADGVNEYMDKLQNLETEKFSWIMERFNRFETVFVHDISTLPDDTEILKKEQESEHIKSFMNVPIEYRGRLFGFMGFDMVRDRAEWSRDIVSLLKIVGEIFVNAIERKKAEEALAQEKERLAVTLRSIGDAVIATDTNGCIVIMNRTAEELTGWTQEEAITCPLEDVFVILDETTRERSKNPITRVLETGRIEYISGQTLLVARDGSEKVIADSVAPILDQKSKTIGAVLVFRDITEDRRIESELQKSHKLESLGILAGGIAHDFNNLLTGILGNISLARSEVDEDNELNDMLKDAEEAALRSKDLTQQLLTFSKGGAPIKKTVSLAGMLKDTAQFSLRGSNVKCEFEIESSLWPVDADEGQLSQVMHNLVLNAKQAMASGGILTIKARNLVSEGSESLLPPGMFTQITVSDQGSGIPEDIVSKIFDPFFTTKTKGSGLGLATAYSIINKHEGFITVSSEKDVGTTFDIYLPASEQNTVDSEQEEKKPLPKGFGRILLMDDEKIVHRIASKMLVKLGYDVVSVYEGNSAIQYYKDAELGDEPFDLVILDLTIPGGMGGKEVIKALMEYDSSVNALVSSGYSTDPIMANYRNFGFRGVVTKPYKLEDLSKTIAQVLSEKLT